MEPEFTISANKPTIWLCFVGAIGAGIRSTLASLFATRIAKLSKVFQRVSSKVRRTVGAFANDGKINLFAFMYNVFAINPLIGGNARWAVSTHFPKSFPMAGVGL